MGKRTIALEIIKLLTCEAKSSSDEPCFRCKQCLAISAFSHPDLNIVEPEKNDITIGQIRSLEARLGVKPAFGQHFAVIDEAHLMGAQAQNAFLKTLEEPRGRVLIVLVSFKPAMLLPTIRSRTQEIKFFRISSEEMQKGFIKKIPAPGNIDDVIRFAGGKPGLAMRFFEDKEYFAKYKEKMEDFAILSSADLGARFKYAGRAASEGNNIADLLSLWLIKAREMFLEGAVRGNSGLASAIRLIKTMQNTEFLLRTTNVNQRLALENLLLDLPRSNHGS